MTQKLSADEETVLRFLYEAKDGGETSADAVCAATGMTRLVAKRALHQLQEKGLIGGPPSLLSQASYALKQIDPEFLSTDAGYNEHILLTASILTKADETFLAEELGFEPEFVNTVGARLRSSGIWSGDRISEDSKAASDGVAFYLAGAIATGDIVVVGKDANGELEYQMTPGGMSHAAELLRRTQR